MIQEILDRFDKEFPILWKTNPPWSSKSPASYVTCEQEIKNFIRSEITSLLESLKREKKPFIKGIAYTTENNVNSGYNQRCTEINEDINKILGKDN